MMLLRSCTVPLLLIEDPPTTRRCRLGRTVACTLTTSQLPVGQASDVLLATLGSSPADDIAILMART